MSPLRMSLLLVSPASVGALVGAGFGSLIGAIAPGYYLAVFRRQLEGGVDPVQMGIGLVAGQGAGAGFVLGLVLLAVSVWRAGKQESSDSEGLSEGQIQSVGDGSKLGVRRVAMLAGFAILLIFVSCVSFFVGGIAGQTDLYNRRASNETRRVQERLNEETHAAAFSRIEYDRTSDGHVYLAGAVQTKADFDLLYRELQDLFGSERASALCSSVAVSTIPVPPETSHHQAAGNVSTQVAAGTSETPDALGNAPFPDQEKGQ